MAGGREITGELRALPNGYTTPVDRRPDDVRAVIGNEYTSSIPHYILDAFAELGLAEEYMPIVGRHIADLHLAFTYRTSGLDVAALKQPGDRRVVWQRRAQISASDIMRYVECVEK